jgi:hypothetical protein
MLQNNNAVAGELIAGDIGFFFMCDPANPASPTPNRMFTFTVNQPSRVDIEVNGFNDPFVYMVDACAVDAAVLECSDDFQPTNVQAGTYWVLVERTGGGIGNFSVTLRLQ